MQILTCTPPILQGPVASRPRGIRKTHICINPALSWVGDRLEALRTSLVRLQGFPLAPTHSSLVAVQWPAAQFGQRHCPLPLTILLANCQVKHQNLRGCLTPACPRTRPTTALWRRVGQVPWSSTPTLFYADLPMPCTN